MMHKANLKIILLCIPVVISCFTAAAAAEKTAEEEIAIIERNKTFLQSSPVKSEDNLDTTSSVSSLERRLSTPLNYVKTREDYTVNLILILPENIIILEITSFLGCFDQLRLSHTNAKFKNIILGEDFWEKEIRKQKYLLWDNSLPRVKAFFANYFYKKGFGRHPLLPERIVSKTEDVSLLPYPNLAEKSLMLGFPKGKENLRQAKHKITMLKVPRTTFRQSWNFVYFPTFTSVFKIEINYF